MYIVLSVFAKVLMEMTDEAVWLFSLLKNPPAFFSPMCQHFMILNLPIALSLMFLVLILTPWVLVCVYVSMWHDRKIS